MEICDADDLSSNDLWVATRGWNHSRSLSVEKVTRKNIGMLGLGARLIQLGYWLEADGSLTKIPAEVMRLEGRNFMA